MILKSHTTIDRFMLETAKDRSEVIEYVTKNMGRNLVEAMLDKIEPGKDYLIKLHGADYYEDFSRDMCGYKMALGFNEIRWIPCSERLPNDDDRVLVSGEGVEPGIVISPGKYVRYWSKKMKHLAWMPLPEPYKEK